MWEMLDPDLECGNECGGPGPPPEFLVPPPPRPPFLAELVNCNEEQLQQTPFGGGATGSFADVDMCEAFPDPYCLGEQTINQKPGQVLPVEMRRLKSDLLAKVEEC
uniref:Uncharacterized protein n=1 Tax=Anopheles minimus TaxID=112268 RepID=A0A182W0X8_9DIPT